MARTGGQVGELKGRFLEAFRECGDVTGAAKVAGIHRSTVYVWLDADEEFAAGYREAEHEVVDTVERRFIDRR